MKLADALKKQEAPAVKPGLGQEQQQAQQVLTTKATGQAAAPQTGPAASSQAARLGLQQAQTEAKDLQLQQRLQDVGQLQQAESQMQQESAQEQSFKDRTASMHAEMDRNTDKMLRQFEMDSARLSDQEKASKMEDITRQMRLTNRSYIDKIERAAKKQQLTSRLERREALARAEMADNESLLKDDLAFKKLMGASDREFTEEIANMELGFAMDLAKSQSEQMNKQAKWQGIGGMMSGGISAYSTYAGAQDKQALADKQYKIDEAALKEGNMSEAEFSAKYGAVG
jgi:hypothetical protein